MTQPRICVVGSSNLDLISYVPRLPRMGETLHGSRFQMGYGGKGANQAVMAAKLGAQVAMVTKVGQDVFGDNTRSNFERWGIDTRHVLSTDQAFSGVASIAVGPGGENSITIVAGANDLLTEADIEAARPVIASAQVLICQLEIPLETTLAALRLAHESGVQTILNPAPARSSLSAEIFRHSDVFCPNETEAELLTGQRVGTMEEVEAVARILLDRGAHAVILTLGDRGSLLVAASETAHVPAPRVKPVDTTGAGDAFVGSLAYFWAAGQPLTEAMRRANIIAATSVESLGTQISFPAASDLPSGLLD
ncbi:MAG: ribokinase [Acidobacteria bacterium]|nr:ribokinase [Acidobacteriota bacterium]